jgi:hypothetical protein
MIIIKKISKAFHALGLIIRQPFLLNHVLNANEVQKKYVSRVFGMGSGLPQIDITGLLPEEGVVVEPFAGLDGGCTPIDLALLKGLCIKAGVKDYLEIGTWRGESVANAAQFAERCVTLNLPDETMLSMGMTEEYTGMHRFFSEKLPHVEHIQADSQTFDFASLNRSFDLIFIDGDHHSDSIARDTENAFSLLKNEHSVIIWHDYAFEPGAPRFEVLAGILRGCPPGAEQHIYHVSNTLCAVYMKNLPTGQTVISQTKPGHYFSFRVRAHKI